MYDNIMYAVAQQALGQREQALDQLRVICDEALLDGAIMPIAEHAEFLAPLLADLGQDPAYAPLVDQVHQYQLVQAEHVQDVILTPREKKSSLPSKPAGRIRKSPSRSIWRKLRSKRFCLPFTKSTTSANGPNCRPNCGTATHPRRIWNHKKTRSFPGTAAIAGAGPEGAPFLPERLPEEGGEEIRRPAMPQNGEMPGVTMGVVSRALEASFLRGKRMEGKFGPREIRFPLVLSV